MSTRDQIDTVDITYQLEEMLPTASERTIERVVDLYCHQLFLYRIDLERTFQANNEANRRRHRGCQKALFLANGLLVAALAQILYLKGWL